MHSEDQFHDLTTQLLTLLHVCIISGQKINGRDSPASALTGISTALQLPLPETQDDI